jgi:hypothetical protein
MHRNALCGLHTPIDEKHTFGLTCLDALFLESIPVPHEQEKECINVSRPGRTAMNNVIQQILPDAKHNFGIKCPSVLLVKSVLVKHELEK